MPAPKHGYDSTNDGLPEARSPARRLATRRPDGLPHRLVIRKGSFFLSCKWQVASGKWQVKQFTGHKLQAAGHIQFQVAGFRL